MMSLLDECIKKNERIAELEAALATERDRAAKGDAFKAWVHARLDQGGVPTHIDGPHSREGCRVGDRMDFVFDSLATERAARERAEADTRRLDKIEAGKIEIAHFDHDGNRPPWACGPGEDWTARGNTIREAIDAATEAGESIQSASPPPPDGPA
jgi:hypothetical protein